MNWLEPIDIYCERTMATLWSEPINAWTNLCFVVAGGLALFLLVQRRSQNTWGYILSLNTISIGVGSFLFHTQANRWSLWADVIPIMLFMLLCFFYILRFVLKWGWSLSLFSLFAFMGLGGFLENLGSGVLNGSLSYAHALFALGLTSFHLRDSQKYVARFLGYATLTFLLSLTFRSVDMLICPAFPLGTHFLWHCLNGLMIWFILKGLFLRPNVPG